MDYAASTLSKVRLFIRMNQKKNGCYLRACDWVFPLNGDQAGIPSERS